MRKHPFETQHGWYADVASRMGVVRQLRAVCDAEGLRMILHQHCEAGALQATVRKAAQQALGKIDRVCDAPCRESDDKWHCAIEDPPDADIAVLGFSARSGCGVVTYDGSHWHDAQLPLVLVFGITHWRHLPEEPEVKS